MSLEQTKRNKQIFAEFMSTDPDKKLSHRQLAHKHGLSHNTIAKIIYRERIKLKIADLERNI